VSHRKSLGTKPRAVARVLIAVLLVLGCQELYPVASVGAVVGSPRILVEQASTVAGLDLSPSSGLDTASEHVGPRLRVEAVSVSRTEMLAQPQNGAWETSAVRPRLIVEGANASVLVTFASDGGFGATKPSGN
jgi:hypothetical protein